MKTSNAPEVNSRFFRILASSYPDIFGTHFDIRHLWLHRSSRKCTFPDFQTLPILFHRADYSLNIFINPYGVWKVLLDGPGRKQLVHGEARSIQQPRVTGWTHLPARWQQEGRSQLGGAEDTSERAWRTGTPPLRRQIITLLRALRTP